MSRILLLAAAVLAATVTGVARAADPPAETPFPSAQVGDVFVAAQTVTANGAMANYFAPGSQVTFRAYAVDGKTHKSLKTADAKYFYVAIPGQPNVKLKYDPKNGAATSALAWVGSWTVPASYTLGLVPFKVLVKTVSKHRGQFVQLPVASAQLTISTDQPAFLTPSPAVPKTTTAADKPLSVSIYTDTVNGTRPTGAPPRLVGCAQTNVFKRGEQFVLRTWGVDMASADVLSSANVDTATATLAGVATPLTLNWGSHGATSNKVWFWSAAWNIPADYPLGDVTVHVVFKTDAGKTGVYDHLVTIIL
jgi:hypothetical protein